ncbi:uncharacterized protein LOC119671147 [Teleopsis dalmanni]|uniref:uncharacterized protein LOC119671147 n=1 Tax=Teleopsis dalmanni TaxID=139649 RepID=UPI0018CDEFEE|nr:uncharacterized protein LOC119671147 [Teleopsis dalmanni]
MDYLNFKSDKTLFTKCENKHKNKNFYEEVKSDVLCEDDFGNGSMEEQQACVSKMDAELLLDDSLNLNSSTTKKGMRFEGQTLFSPPFFEMQNTYNDQILKNTLIARCCTCSVVLRGHKNVSSNFLKHLRNQHTYLYKKYETIKFAKSRNSRKRKSNFVLEYEEPNSLLDYEQSSENTDSHITQENASPPEVKPTLSIEQNLANDPLSIMDNMHEQDALEMNGKMTEDKRNINNELANNEFMMNIDNILEHKLKDFITKKNYVSNAEVNSLPEENLQNSMHVALEKQVCSLQKECEELRKHLEQTKIGREQLQREVQAMDRYIRRKSIVIRNIHINDYKNPHNDILQFFGEKLSLPNIDINNVNIMTKSNNSRQKCSLVVELKNDSDAKLIYKNCCKLKNTGIFVEPFNSQYTQRRKEKLIVLRKEIKRRKPELKVFVQGHQLAVNGTSFYWDDMEGLCIARVINWDNCTVKPAAEYLETATGLNLSEFLNVLKNYNVQFR